MEAISRAEFAVLDWISETRCPFLDGFFGVFSCLLEYGILWIALALLMLCSPKYRRCGMVLLVAMGVCLLLCSGILKPLLMRERPFRINGHSITFVKVPTDYSFPSGHSSQAVLGAVVITMFHKKWALPTAAVAVFTCLSRLYFYVHFPTDVLGGALIGASVGLCAVLLGKKYLPDGFLSYRKGEDIYGRKNSHHQSDL